jgi:hypothetical protein
MRPYDAVFLAVALGLFLTRPRRWWLAALAPAIALAAHELPLDRFATPVAAIAACLLVPRYAPVALVLAIPIYEGPADVLRAALLWLAVSALMEGLEDRLNNEVLPSQTRLMSARLVSVAVLYYTLLPVVFL